MMAAREKGFPMNAHFTVFGASFIHEGHGFNPAPRRHEPLAVWGLILGGLLFAVTTAATITATTLAHAAVY
jgi:hypothetical protein